MIEEQFVSFDTARMLKEAGFEAECGFTVDDDGRKLYRPTQALAARWIREVNGIHVSSNIFMDSANDADGKTVDEWTFWSYDLFDNSGRIIEESDDRYDSYEEAIEAGLKHCLELIKK